MAPTFASAAAGNRDSSSRQESTGDWARRNGATQTFRRPSHAATPSGSTNHAHSRDASGTPSVSSSNAGVYVPPHAQSGRNGSSVEGRYSRDQLIQLFRVQSESDDIKDGLSELYVGSWEPNVSNGAVSALWGRRDDNGSQGQSGVDLCWDKLGSILPLSLTDMTEEEKESFTSSVNSPIKPLTQNPKDGTPKESLSLRKASLSQVPGGGAPYGVSSPTANRPANRRRDTAEAYPFPSSNQASPAPSRFSRDESSAVTPPPALVRRRTDFKEPAAGGASEERDKDKSVAENVAPFSALKRTTTAPFSTTPNPANWSATSPATAFSPMGAFGSFANPQLEKKPGYGSMRGESRFKGLMSKTSTEDLDKTTREKTSLGNLGKVSEAEPSKQPGSWMEGRSGAPASKDTDAFSDEEQRSGSAALGGGHDHPQGHGAFATPHKRDQREESGFSAFGMTADSAGLRDIFHARDNVQQTPQHRGGAGHEPMSPTNTNPFQSPEHDRIDQEDVDTDGEESNHQYPGMGSFQVEPSAAPGLHHGFGGLAGLGRVSQPFEVAASDRSQTSSAGPSRGFPIHGLGGIPGLGGPSAWTPGQQQSIGTPVRDRGIGGGFDMFGSVGGEAQSPSLAGLGNSSLFGSAGGLGGTGTIGRTSRLGSLFPTAMQEQMRQGDHRPSVDEAAQGERQHSMSGSFGRGAFGSQAPGGSIPARDTSSPLRRGLFDTFSGGLDDGKRDTPDPIGPAFGQIQSSGPPQSSMFSAAQPGISQVRTAHSTSTQSPSISSPASAQPPAPQQRTMVMPDRMRWIYRDPEGKTQGPFSGLEMHDWYKAGFFSPELLVKKYEEPEYEPLAQLIRRIGNSREPFLVPQIGIPHGPPTTQPGNAWAGSSLATSAATGAQPPFANNFPTFGTTLTAEQQNALERRKQEEQYLMARQKEHLAAQQQAMAKQAQIGIGPHAMLPHQLQHHSSAHSLHSQPSYGSITSPGGYQPSPTQGPLVGGPAPVPGLFDTAFRPAPVPGLGPIGPGMDMLGNIREEEAQTMMERLSLGRTGQPPLGTAPLPFGQQQLDSNIHAQQVVTMLGDRARLQREQVEHDMLQRMPLNEQQAAQASADRLQQFQDLRVQTDMDQGHAAPPSENVIARPPGATAMQQEQQEDFQTSGVPGTQSQHQGHFAERAAAKTEQLSLTEQVQKAASAKQSPQAHTAWAKVEPAIHPFPPPPSQSPLPAPSAQRKPIVADTLAGESRSRSETPSADTPSASIAPWAKEPTEAPKGPSLKEIQEAEARKAAEREAAAAAARREAAEKELLAQAQSPATLPGLPSSSTWASGSPITPVGGGLSAWAKPVGGKPTPQPGANKKTLQQIQKEEEARKAKLAAQQAANASTAAYGIASPSLASGKRYADLASKQTPAPPGTASGAWTTVGASGKVKAPTAAPAAPAAVTRTASSGIVPAAVKKPAVTRGTSMGSQVTKANAEEEFRKWAVGELSGDLNKSINAEEFVASLLSFPQDVQLITESVHSASRTLDSRHFAEEFLRRRKLAEKGIVDSATIASPAEAKAGAGGWSEVAKKGGQNAQQQQSALDTGNYKVVAAKKKNVKR